MKKIFTNKIFLLFILVFLFIIISTLEGNSFFQKKENESRNIALDSQDKIIEKTEEIDEEIIIEEGVEVETPTATKIPESNSQNSIDFLIYPNSKIVSKNNSEVVLESDANTDEITDWYKGKIDEHDMSVTSTVRTTTNGNVLNKLSAAGSNLKVEIEISRSNSDNFAKIVAKLL